MRGIASLGIAVFLSACASAPSAYYSLSAPVPAVAPAARPAPAPAQTPAQAPAQAQAPGTAGFGLRIQAVRIPAEADRPQLVVRRQPDDAGVAVLNESLWAAPLADQIRSVLSARVSRALGAPDLSLMAPPEGLPLREVAVQVTRFDLVFGHYAGLEAIWSEGRRSGQSPRLCQAAVRVPVASGVPALVEGQRRAVDLLADVIAARMDPALARPDDPAILQDRCR